MKFYNSDRYSIKNYCILQHFLRETVANLCKTIIYTTYSKIDGIIIKKVMSFKKNTLKM